MKECDYPGHATWTLTAENDGEYLLLEMLIRALRRVRVTAGPERLGVRSRRGAQVNVHEAGFTTEMPLVLRPARETM